MWSPLHRFGMIRSMGRRLQHPQNNPCRLFVSVAPPTRSYPPKASSPENLKDKHTFKPKGSSPKFDNNNSISISNYFRSLPTKEKTMKILIYQCEQRGLKLTKKARHKPWRMALMIRRHDLGWSEEEIDQDIGQGGMEPDGDEILRWVRARQGDEDAQQNDDEETRTSHHEVEWATEQIMKEKQGRFIKELLDSCQSRKIVVNRGATRSMNESNFLFHLAQLVAQAFAAGKGQLNSKRTNAGADAGQVDPSNQPKSKRQRSASTNKNSNKRNKKVPRVRAPWAVNKKMKKEVGANAKSEDSDVGGPGKKKKKKDDLSELQKKEFA